MMKKLLPILFLTICSISSFGCATGGSPRTDPAPSDGTDETRSRKILESSGFTNIEFHGHAFFSCSDDDSVTTGGSPRTDPAPSDGNTSFTALGPKGNIVSGAVCCGYLKDCTIRFE